MAEFSGSFSCVNLGSWVDCGSPRWLDSRDWSRLRSSSSSPFCVLYSRSCRKLGSSAKLLGWTRMSANGTGPTRALPLPGVVLVFDSWRKSGQSEASMKSERFIPLISCPSMGSLSFISSPAPPPFSSQLSLSSSNLISFLRLDSLPGELRPDICLPLDTFLLPKPAISGDLDWSSS